jgi:hypothetical protein
MSFVLELGAAVPCAGSKMYMYLLLSFWQYWELNLGFCAC